MSSNEKHRLSVAGEDDTRRTSLMSDAGSELRNIQHGKPLAGKILNQKFDTINLINFYKFLI